MFAIIFVIIFWVDDLMLFQSVTYRHNSNVFFSIIAGTLNALYIDLLEEKFLIVTLVAIRRLLNWF